MIDIPTNTLAYFPFDTTRPGQSGLIKEIYYSVSAKKHVVIEAPNGIGKTVSALCSIVPYLKDSKKGRVLIYCTRTHSQMDQVLEELKNIQDKKNVKIKGISFKGRKKMCINDVVIEQAGSSREFIDLCNNFRKKDKCLYFKELSEHEIDRELNVDRTLTAADLMALGKEMDICPYFLGKKLVSTVDLIATTFSYMINPFIRNIFLKDVQREISDLIILFDECHNLPDQAMEASSDQLPISSVGKAIKELEILGGNAHVGLPLLKFHRHVLEKKLDPYLQRTDINELDFEVPKELLKEMIKLMAPDPEELMQTYKKLGRKAKKNKIDLGERKRNISYLLRYARFVELLYKSVDDAQYLHRFLVKKTKSGMKISHEIKCLDCRIALKSILEARSCIFLSGTLSPLGAFMEIMGLLKNKTSRLTIESPFSPSQLLIGSVSGINSKFNSRTPAHFQKIATYITKIANATPFNTGVFVPSYGYLYNILQTTLKAELLKRNIFLYAETKQFNPNSRDMIQKFKSGHERGTKGVLLSVLGGKYSEGVDFPGDEMNTAVVIGIPLPKPSYHVSKLEEFYEHAFGSGKGKDYGYNVPALRKSNQAAGRPVRRLIDKGVVVFLDERYNSNYYKRFLSSWIKKKFIHFPTHPGLLAKKIEDFFAP